MKCPFRKITRAELDDIEPRQTTDFADCYREECMAYVPEIDDSNRHGKDITAARCLRMDWRVILSEINNI